MLRKLQLKTGNTQGFTLIELMIVIAIIGILAAIAIPNFISYRNKTFCSATESDAGFITNAVASYFSIPANRSITKNSLTVGGHVRAELSNKNTWALDADDVDSITITVNDITTRCPLDYRTAMDSGNNPTGYWLNNAYIRIIKM